MIISLFVVLPGPLWGDRFDRPGGRVGPGRAGEAAVLEGEGVARRPLPLLRHGAPGVLQLNLVQDQVGSTLIREIPQTGSTG